MSKPWVKVHPYIALVNWILVMVIVGRGIAEISVCNRWNTIVNMKANSFVATITQYNITLFRFGRTSIVK